MHQKDVMLESIILELRQSVKGFCEHGMEVVLGSKLKVYDGLRSGWIACGASLSSS